MIQKLYQSFFNAAITRLGATANVVPTPWRGNTVSSHSKSFALGNAIPSTLEETANVLIRTFGIRDEEQFRTKLREACSGSGREYRRICTVHSSALMALNFFYRVSCKCCLHIEGETYTQALFEVRNKVFANPSNIDVLLVSANGKKLLYLESKLTEYIAYTGKCRNISGEYMPYYKNLDLYEEGKEIIDVDSHSFSLNIINDGKAQYSEGMKQMISHFFGLCNGPAADASEDYKKLFDEADTLLLGEIVFKFDGFEAQFKLYDKLYAELYSVLSSRTWAQKHKHQIQIFPHLLTYQEIASKPENADYMANTPQAIKDFYNFK